MTTRDSEEQKHDVVLPGITDASK